MEFVVALKGEQYFKEIKNLGVHTVIVEPELVEKAKQYGFSVWARFTRLYDQQEVESVKRQLSCLDCDAVLINDLGVKMMCDEVNPSLQTVYAPETLLTNSYDVKELIHDGISKVVISKDIPLSDMYDIASENEGKCYIRIHGPVLLSYSKRHYIAAYLNSEFKDYTDGYYLQEQSRTQKLPYLENQYGSYLYGDTLQSYQQITDLSSSKLKGVIIDNLLSEDSYTLQCVKNYMDVLAGKPFDPEWLNDGYSYMALAEIRKTELEKEKKNG